MYNSDRRNSLRRSSQHRQSSSIGEGYRKKEAEFVLPHNGLRSSIIIGLVGGLLALFIPMGITYANASLFSQAARLDQSMPFQAAILASLWSVCGSVIVGLVIAFVVGMVTGRIAAKHWLVSLARTFPGACIALYYIITAYIPGYPGHISSGTAGSPVGLAQGVIFDIGAVIIWALIGALVGFCGTLFTTPKPS